MANGNHLFSHLFEIAPVKKQSTGRSADLHADKVKCLLLRYVYFGRISGFRGDLLRKIVAQDFFLSETRVMDIITINSAELKKIRTTAIDKRDLVKQYPGMNWECPQLQNYL